MAEEFNPMKRLDGTWKDRGFDSIQNPDGSYSTELSIGLPNSQYPFIPSVYEGITPWEMQTLSNVATYGYDPLQNDVYRNAYTQAMIREGQGKSPFWQEGEPTNSMVGPAMPRKKSTNAMMQSMLGK